jgi:hypothetical protein
MSTAPLLLRLNGRPQACDPCRARKVACDHVQPTCSRCKKRHETCVYTVSGATVKKQRLRSPVRTEHPPQPQSTNTADSTPSPAVAPGYLGFTSHNAVFEETRNSLSLVHGPPVEAEPRAPRGRSVIDLPSHLRDMSLYVLRCLPQSQHDVMAHRLHCLTDGWIFRTIQDILTTLHRDWGRYLTSRDDAELDELARHVSHNTARPLRDEHSSAKAWTDQFTGRSIRWESIGLIWTYWDGSPSFDAPVVVKCLGYCIELARHFTPGNDILLYLCYRRVTTESLVSGDAGKLMLNPISQILLTLIGLTCWRYFAETVALLTFLGRHVGSEDTNYIPSLCSEHRRRITALVFNIDKVLVSFTGRPPLLSRRFFSSPLPLDLTDLDLQSDQATVRHAVQELDANGFRHVGDLKGSSMVRARAQIAYIKDELLEIALANSVKVTFESLAYVTLILWSALLTRVVRSRLALKGRMRGSQRILSIDPTNSTIQTVMSKKYTHGFLFD